MLVLAAALTICAAGARNNCVRYGDGFWLGGQRIRIHNVDTPDLNGQCASDRALAIRASNRLRELLSVGDIKLHRLGRDEDQYDRKLRVASVNGRDVGDQLVSEGLARTWSGRRAPWC